MHGAQSTDLVCKSGCGVRLHAVSTCGGLANQNEGELAKARAARASLSTFVPPTLGVALQDMQPYKSGKQDCEGK